MSKDYLCCDKPKCIMSSEVLPLPLPQDFNKYVEGFFSNLFENMEEKYSVQKLGAEKRSILKEIIKSTFTRHWQVFDPILLLQRKNHLFEKSQGGMIEALNLGYELEIGDDSLRALALGTIVRDIGMLSVPKKVLVKESKFNLDDRAHINKHPFCGAQIISKNFLSNNPYLPQILAIVRGHHYYGMSGTEFKDLADIAMIGDAFFGRHYNALERGNPKGPIAILGDMRFEHESAPRGRFNLDYLGKLESLIQ